MNIIACEEAIQVLIKFRVRGILRFLSHAETARVFQRAFARAGVAVQFSQGFNPHPKMSLPLPRAVGVESDDELLCIKIKKASLNDISELRQLLKSQIPLGIELLEINSADTKISAQPEKVVYSLKINTDYIDQHLQSTVQSLLSNESLCIKRQLDSKGRVKQLDVRSFLNSIKLNENEILVECNVTPNGSVRVDEILELLGLDVNKLSAPVKRISIQWQKS